MDVRDVAEVAAMALIDPDTHRAQGYTLTGPARVTFEQAARMLSRALGQAIRYQPASLPGYARHLRRRQLSWAQIAVQTILHVGLRLSQAAKVDPTLERLLGRPGRTLEQYIDDHADVWRAPVR